jgi:hypothetical protein
MKDSMFDELEELTEEELTTVAGGCGCNHRQQGWSRRMEEDIAFIRISFSNCDSSASSSYYAEREPEPTRSDPMSSITVTYRPMIDKFT